ncbi:uncharacterized protein LOC115597434 [Sparus aurata]|uniref:uncharacterized protein LOC115597434 n=1 Tax=Sparus aurata TaxID=8175 RepID=UPI0011C0CA54|nr:uncharacterized protein LOC115597434 [Sparus aurata]
MVSGGGEGFEHFYDPLSHTGFIEIRLRNIRRSLEEGQRRYHRRKWACSAALAQPSTAQPLDDKDLREWLFVIKRMKPSPENMGPIKTAMEKALSHRRNWISTQSPTSRVCWMFVKKFEGKAELFVRRWESSFIPKLRKIAALEKGVVSSLLDQAGDQKDDQVCYSTLQILTHLLPPTASGRGSASTLCSVNMGPASPPFAVLMRDLQGPSQSLSASAI